MRTPRKPMVEFRIPISANDRFLRMTHYFLESLKMHGGDITKDAKCVLSISRDEPKRDLFREYPWLGGFAVDLRWVDEPLFRRYEYDATGLDRLLVASKADIIVLCDADILITGSLDDVVLRAFHSRRQLGLVAHVSPFDNPGLTRTPSEDWWRRIFFEAGLPCPRLGFNHTAWKRIGHSGGIAHRVCPNYFNYGFIVSPREYVEQMAQSFEMDLQIVDRVVQTPFKSQIANTIAYTRHTIPCAELSLNYNFPLHIPERRLRADNPAPQGENRPRDVRVFHYLGDGEFSKQDFRSESALTQALQRGHPSDSGKVFQEQLQKIHQRIAGHWVNRDVRGDRTGRGTMKRWLRRSIRLGRGSRVLWALYGMLRALRRGYYRLRLHRSGSDSQLLIRLVDAYLWSEKHFDQFGSSFFDDAEEMRAFFHGTCAVVVDRIRLTAKEQRQPQTRDFNQAVDRASAIFSEQIGERLPDGPPAGPQPGRVQTLTGPDPSDTRRIVTTVPGRPVRAAEVPMDQSVQGDGPQAGLEPDGGPCPRLFLVCGGRRTGTTLLTAILSSHHEANPVGQEAQILTRLMEVYRWANRTGGALGHSVAPVLRARLRELVRIMSHGTRAKGVLVLKNPEFSLVIRELHEVFPEAILLATMRDPRDQVSSAFEVAERRNDEVRTDWNYVSRNIAGLAREYHDYVANLLELEGRLPGSIIFVRYEDLTLDPESEIHRLRLQTGLQIPSEPQQVWNNVSSKALLDAGPSRSPLYGKPITASSVGRFIRDLSDREVGRVEEICAPVMNRFRYERHRQDEKGGSSG